MKDEVKKEESIDLAEFYEAQIKIQKIQKQFCELVLDEFEKKSEFMCGNTTYQHTTHADEFYFCMLTVSNIPVTLRFTVFPMEDKSFWFAGLHLNCSELLISDRFIQPRKKLSFALTFASSDEKILLNYVNPGEI